VILSKSGEVPDGVAAYAFDKVFGTDSAQSTIYEKCVKPAVSAVLQGYNATVLAYG